MRTIELQTPFDNNVLNDLHIGDKVLISGTIYTARDKAHQLLAELIINGKPLPIELAGTAIYYTGPAIDDSKKKIISAGPTTSSRMDQFTPQLLKLGVKVLIGKGRRDREVIESLKEHRVVYFCAVGGAGAYLAERIKSLKVIAFPELGMEAIYELKVEQFPCYVAIDTRGNSIFNSNN